MKVGDLVALREKMYDSRNRELCLIIDIETNSKTYTSAGCKKYTVLRDTGHKYKCWKGDLEEIKETTVVINESR